MSIDDESNASARALRMRLASGTLIGAAVVAPVMWLTAGTLPGDFVAGVWVGTLAAFIMVAGPLPLPERPGTSRALVTVVTVVVGIFGLWLLRGGLGQEGAGGSGMAPLLAFGVGAILAHWSWSVQINRTAHRIDE
ncbi:MAG: hypothetical protein U5L11_04195 [Arhodomonas sp.]|nr:hypothetical protein [Arhodomonas sp.]